MKHDPNEITRVDVPVLGHVEGPIEPPHDAGLAAALATLAAHDRELQASPATKGALLMALRSLPDGKIPAPPRSAVYSTAWLWSTAAAAILLLTLLAARPPWLRPPAAIPAAAATASTSSSDAFIQLPFADPPEMIRRAQIVRVEATAGDLRLLGLSVAASTSPRSIPVDLLIGENGVPEAIRFIQ